MIKQSEVVRLKEKKTKIAKHVRQRWKKEKPKRALIRKAFVVLLASFLLYTVLTSDSMPLIEARANALYIRNSNERFRFVGGNHFNLFAKYMVSFSHITPEEVFDISQQSNIRVLRFWATCSNGYWSEQCLYENEKSWNKSKEEFFRRFDKLLEDAEQHRIYVIPVLVDSFGTFKAVGEGSEVCQVGSKANTEYKRFVEDIVTRYKDRTVVLMWEIGNEGNLYCSDAYDLVNWYKDTAAFIKSIDSNHMVSTGENNFGSLDKGMFKIINSDKNIDIASMHIYSHDLYNIEWGNRSKEEKIGHFVAYWTQVAHDELDKPVYFGEFGPAKLSEEENFYGKFLKNSFVSDADGAILWSWLEGEDCLQPASDRIHCVDPSGTPAIVDEVKFYSEKFR